MVLDAWYSASSCVRGVTSRWGKRGDMATHKDRIDLLELEMRFRRWLWHERLLESLSVEQLEEYACLGLLPDQLPKLSAEG